MTIADIVGWFATAASVISFVPQAWKVIKTGKTEDISVGMYCLTVTGFTLWIGYGALLGAWPLVATNTVCAMLSLFILVMTVLPPSKTKAVAETLDPPE